MKNKLALVAMLAVFVLVLSACGGAATSNSSSTSTSTAAPGSTADSTAESQPVVDEGPPVDLTMAFLVTGSIPADLAEVQAAVNEIVTPKINANITLLPINFGAAMEQYNLMLSSNEKLDLMITFPATYTSLVGQGKVQEIGHLIDEYAPAVTEALGGFYEGSRVNGKIYGVRPISDFAGGASLMIRKDIADKYGIDPNGITSIEKVEDALRVIKENEPDFYPMGYSNQDLSITATLMQFEVDNLGDNFGVLMNYGKELKVENLYETERYKETVKMLRDWYQKGYIMKDIDTSQEDQHSLIAAGKTYCYFTPSKPGIAAQESAQNGFECYVAQFQAPFSSTFNITLWQWVVPNACTTPEKAVQMLNLMYSDADLMNYLAWGVEGKHYAKQSDGTIGFPEGISMENSGYFPNTPWMFGNEYLAHVWTGNDPGIWEETKKFNDSAIISKAMGFTWDSTPVKTEVASVTSVYSQYKMALENGTVDFDTVYPQFIDKLKAAGIDKIIEEKQKQLDAWAATK